MKYDFGKIDVNQWTVELDPSNMRDYLNHVEGTIDWIRSTGWGLLESEDPLTFEQWKLLQEKICDLYKCLHGSKPAVFIFEWMVTRGISDLNSLAQVAGDKVVVRKWAISIYYLTRTGAMTDMKKMESVDAMMPAVQYLQEDYILQILAGERAPGDARLQQLYIAHYKNW